MHIYVYGGRFVRVAGSVINKEAKIPQRQVFNLLLCLNPLLLVNNLAKDEQLKKQLLWEKSLALI